MTEITRTKGEMKETKGEVCYKLSLQRYGTHFERFGQAIVDYSLEVTSISEHSHTHGGSFHALVKINIEDIDDMLEDVDPVRSEYKSPTFFENSQICPIYETPEDEINDNPTDRYKRFKNA